jgi:hypothetical protein
MVEKLERRLGVPQNVNVFDSDEMKGERVMEAEEREETEKL